MCVSACVYPNEVDGYCDTLIFIGLNGLLQQLLGFDRANKEKEKKMKFNTSNLKSIMNISTLQL